MNLYKLFGMQPETRLFKNENTFKRVLPEKGVLLIEDHLYFDNLHITMEQTSSYRLYRK